MCVLVIGIGNTLRRDDGVGVAVAEVIAALAPNCIVVSAHQLLPEMALAVCEATCVVFVDADLSLAPGDVQCRPLDPAPDGGVSAHHLSPGGLLFTAMALYGASPSAHLVSVGVADLAVGEGLSDVVAACVPRAVSVVQSLL